MTIQKLQDRIAHLKARLPFADSQNYYRDQGEILRLEQEINEIRNGVVVAAQPEVAQITPAAELATSLPDNSAFDIAEWRRDLFGECSL